MRKIAFLFVIGVLLASCGSETNEYKVNGQIDGVTEGQAVLQKIESTGPVPLDTAEIMAGEFSFSGSIEYPELHLVYVNENQMPVAFFLEEGNIEIQADIDSMQAADVKGSPLSEKFETFNEEVPSRQRSEELQQEFMAARESGDQEVMEKLAEEYQSIMMEQQQYVNDFVFENTDNAVGAFLAMNMANAMEPDELDELISSFEKNIPGHPYVQELKELQESAQQQPEMPQQQPQQPEQSQQPEEAQEPQQPTE